MDQVFKKTSSKRILTYKIALKNLIFEIILLRQKEFKNDLI